MPYKDYEKQKEWQRRWAKTHREIAQRYRHKLRIKVLNFLGGKCINCGCNDFEALEINHKNGGGAKEYKKTKARISNKVWYRAILTGKRKRDDLELTCRVCNSYHYLKILKQLKGDWKIVYVPPK